MPPISDMTATCLYCTPTLVRESNKILHIAIYMDHGFPVKNEMVGEKFNG
jgi:hypothetical protein